MTACNISFLLQTDDIFGNKTIAKSFLINFPIYWLTGSYHNPTPSFKWPLRERKRSEWEV